MVPGYPDARLVNVLVPAMPQNELTNHLQWILRRNTKSVTSRVDTSIYPAAKDS